MTNRPPRSPPIRKSEPLLAAPAGLGPPSVMHPSAETLITLALEEDLGKAGDLTSRYFVDPGTRTTGRIVAREPGVLAGSEIGEACFRRVDESLDVRRDLVDGAKLDRGDVVMTISGEARSILTAERPALNFMQRLSGVASLTAEFVAAADNDRVRVLDTRKTTPGFRHLQKEAVRAGGGHNHRMGLYDMVMVKDNHLLSGDASEDLAASIRTLREAHPEVRVEVEADTLDQVNRFLGIEGIDVIMLDNMSNDQMREAVAIRDAGKSGIELEASGGVNLETIGGIAATGVDCISVGALTHSARSLDLGMDFE